VEPSKIHLTVKATAVIADEGFKAVGKAVGRAVASSGGSPLKAAAAAAQAATVNGGTAADAADVAAATASDLGASKTTIMKAAGDAAAVAVIDAGGSDADAVKASAAAAASAGGSKNDAPAPADVDQYIRWILGGAAAAGGGSGSGDSAVAGDETVNTTSNKTKVLLGVLLPLGFLTLAAAAAFAYDQKNGGTCFGSCTNGASRQESELSTTKPVGYKNTEEALVR